MALDKNSKLSDIVAILQECEGINQKEELKNILTNIGMSVPNNASMADMIILLKESDFNLSDVIQRLQNIVGGLNEISELSSVLNEKNIATSSNDSLEDLILKVKDIKQPTGNAEPDDVIQGKIFSNKDNIDLIGNATIQSMGGYAPGDDISMLNVNETNIDCSHKININMNNTIYTYIKNNNYLLGIMGNDNYIIINQNNDSIKSINLSQPLNVDNQGNEIFGYIYGEYYYICNIGYIYKYDLINLTLINKYVCTIITDNTRHNNYIISIYDDIIYYFSNGKILLINLNNSSLISTIDNINNPTFSSGWEKGYFLYKKNIYLLKDESSSQRSINIINSSNGTLILKTIININSNTRINMYHYNNDDEYIVLIKNIGSGDSNVDGVQEVHLLNINTLSEITLFSYNRNAYYSPHAKAIYPYTDDIRCNICNNQYLFMYQYNTSNITSNDSSIFNEYTFNTRNGIKIYDIINNKTVNIMQYIFTNILNIIGIYNNKLYLLNNELFDNTKTQLVMINLNIKII